MTRTLTLLLLFAALTTPLAAEDTIWVVRHAEKAEDGTTDPPLSAKGIARAAAIAERLASEDIVAIYTTRYRRTSHTAQATAEAIGVESRIYEPVDFGGVAAEAWKHDGNVLIVGHSNTVLPIVRALGAKVEGTIEESDYSRLYRVTTADDGTVSAELVSLPVPSAD